MICGFVLKDSGRPNPGVLYRMLGTREASSRLNVIIDGSVSLGSVDETSQPTNNGSGEHPKYESQSTFAIWKGEIYNRAELLLELGYRLTTAQGPSDTEILVKLYEAYGLSCVEKINGSFAFAIYDKAREEVILGRDRFGIQTLYYYDSSKMFVFGSRIPPILACPEIPKELNQDALRRFLVFGFNPGWDTFFRGIKKLRPARLLVLSRAGLTEKRYWYLSFRQVQKKSLPEYCHDILDLSRDAIRLRLPDAKPLGIFLSGGMDSSSVAGLTHEIAKKDFSTYSYRCLGKSFDESPYARTMAKHCNAEHHEIVFRPADIRRMQSMVRLMDEPFCNAGITIATFLLGEAAEGKIARVFSGDGGDELFGGHPVYAADKIAAKFERIPSIFRLSFVGLLRYLPDSDQKLNLTVKLKRFAESINYPRALGTYRWRIQYGPAELNELLHNGTAPHNDRSGLFEDLIDLIQEADGPDALSRSLYVDTMTEIGFCLRRMDLVRYFKITPAFPLLDYRLFEYAAGIPSNLKFRDPSNTKVIQHRAMEAVLPDEIVHRKDKLGHSIPLKNWMRTEPTVRQFVQDVIFTGRLKASNFVNDDYLKALWNNHQNYRQNNSHRLWSLAVLELWLSAHRIEHI
jgi:asparagine synthase (glutamine-hydrolysing)